MKEEIFDAQLSAAIQRLEQFWLKADTMPDPSRQFCQTLAAGSNRSEERLILRESLEELSNSLQELQSAVEELHQKNEELAISRVLVETERQRYQELFEFTPYPYLVTDLQGVIQEANQAAGKLLNREKFYLVGKPLAVFISESVRGEFRRQLLQLQKDNSTREWELEIKIQEQEAFPAVCTAVPVQNRNGNIISIRWQLRDITKRKQTEQMEPRLQMLDQILWASPAKICLIDRRGKCLYASPAVAKNVGLAQLEIIGKTWRGLNFTSEIMKKFEAQLKQVLTTGIIVTDELNFPVVEGTKYYEYTIAKMGDSSGFPDAVIVTFQNITKHRQAEAKINESLAQQKEMQQMKARLISLVSHEIRSPLANISASVELLAKYGYKWDEEKKNQQFQVIQSAVKQINLIFGDFLVVCKAEAGKLEANPSLLDLKNFCLQLTEQMQCGLGKQHRINYLSQGSHTTASLDQKLLSYILVNLFANAIKYSPSGSTIEFLLICESEAAIFRIKDSGIGIPVKDQAHLFSWFQRGSNVGNIEGIGLGLSIVKQCVDLHQGKIVVESQEEVGTTVTVTLPRQRRSDESVIN